MAVWTVTGYERTVRMMRVEADTEEEAIELAKAGAYDAVDTEPGPTLMRPAWTATEGWHHGKPHSADRRFAAALSPETDR